MISDFRSNRVYFSAKMLFLCPVTFKGLTETLNYHNVEWHLLEGTNDIWCRDYMPIQITEDVFAGYRYYPDYLLKSKKYIQSITDGVSLSENMGFNLDNQLIDIIIDGGNIVKCDDKIIMTSKVFEENPSYTVTKLSSIIENAMEAELIVVPWDVHEYFGHSDGICRYTGKDTLLLTSYREIDSRMTDRFLKCLKPHFREVNEIHFSKKTVHPYRWAYINWLQVENLIILPSFGIEEDEEALIQIKEYMPGYKNHIEQVPATDLIIHEGCFNCASWTIFTKDKALSPICI